MTGLPYHVSRSVAAFVLLLGAWPGQGHAQVTAQLDPGRTLNELGVGLGVGNALLGFEGRQYQALPRDMEFETELIAVPQLALQLRHWQARSFGVELKGSVGYLPSLRIPPTMATTPEGKEASLQVITHEIQVRFLYRLHLSDSPRSLALQAEVGFELIGYDIQETDPPSLVSTTYVGPTLLMGFLLPLGRAFSLAASGGIFLPFYVLEEPVNSGRVDQSNALSLRLAAEYQVSKGLALELLLRRVDISTKYCEHGSRGISGNGVFDGKARDTFHELGLNLHFRI